MLIHKILINDNIEIEIIDELNSYLSKWKSMKIIVKINGNHDMELRLYICRYGVVLDLC